MDQLQTQQMAIQTPVQEPHFIQEEPKPNYFIRLFRGRLNRQNYIVGSTFFVLLPTICFIIVIFNILLSPDTFAMPSLDTSSLGNLGSQSIQMPQTSLASLLGTPTNEFWSAIGILFIILSLPYLFSLQIKRLHDLNLSGWLWILNVVPFISLNALPMPGATTISQTWFLTANVISLAASIFSFYVTVAPGTNGPNKYGDKPIPRTNFLSDIMQLR